MKNARFLPLKLSVQLKVHGHISEEINSYPEFTFFPSGIGLTLKERIFTRKSNSFLPVRIAPVAKTTLLK